MFSETNITYEDTGIYSRKLNMGIYPPLFESKLLNLGTSQQPCSESS